MGKTSYAILKDAPANSLINPNFNQKPALVLKDGTLWIVVDKHLYKSDDYGFTWVRKQRGVSGVGDTSYFGDVYTRSDQNTYPCVELSYVEHDAGRSIRIECGGGIGTSTNYPGLSNSSHIRWNFLLEDDVYYDFTHLVGTTANARGSILNTKDGGTNYFDSLTDGLFSGIFTKAYTTEDTWAVDDILIRDPDNLDVTTTRHADRSVNTYNYKNIFSSNGIHCIAGITATPDRLVHIKVTDYGTPTISETIVQANTGTLDAISALAKDSYGNYMYFWRERDYGSPGVVTYGRGLSINSGSTWSQATATSYMGGVGGGEGTPVDVLGCENGFIFLNVGEVDVATGTPRLFVNTYTTTDGTSYTLGTSREATSLASGIPIYGGHFFRPEEDVWFDLDRPGDIRIAYQTANSVEQELLSETAYPSSEIINTIGTNVDFIDEPGASGNMTKLYLDAFKEVGVTCTFHKYVPTASGKMNDKSTYSESIDCSGQIVIDPESYRFPIPDLNTQETSDYVEKDVRKIFLQPNLHIDREFLVNEGNFLKRTVWTVDYDGNAYELSQVVPRFIDEQICFYTSNAYVVGQSNDPWSRTVLLSET